MCRLATITVILALGLSAATWTESAPRAVATHTATRPTKSEICSALGTYSDTVVQNRDLGMTPMETIAVIDELARSHPERNAYFDLMRWVVISVHKYDAFDATRLRRMVEVACYESAF